MVIQDNIQAVNIDGQVGVNGDRVANSIRFRQESVINANNKYTELLGLIAQKEEALEKLKEQVKNDVENGATYETVIDNNTTSAEKVAKLEEEIHILGLTAGPMELVDSRAIKLIKKMYKEMNESSNSIYAKPVSKNEELEVVPTEDKILEIMPNEENKMVTAPIEDNKLEIEPKDSLVIEPKDSLIIEPKDSLIIEPNEKLDIVSDIDVRKVSQDNSEVFGQSIENAIADEVVEIPTIEEPTNNETMKIVSEPVVEQINGPVMVNSFDKPSEEEIARIRENEQFNKYQEINEEIARIRKEVEEANEAKEFDLSSNLEKSEEIVNTEGQIRDDVVIVPEREEQVEQKNSEIADDLSDQRSIVMTSSEKEKAHEIMEKLNAARKKREELRKEADLVQSDMENQKEINAEVTARQVETEKTLNESIEVVEKTKQAYNDMISSIQEELTAINNENATIESDTQSKREELVTIREDIINKKNRIGDLELEIKKNQDEKAEYDSLMEIVNEKSIVEETNDYQKVA